MALRNPGFFGDVFEREIFLLPRAAQCFTGAVQMQLGIFFIIGFFGHKKLPWPDHFATLFALPGYSTKKASLSSKSQ